MNICTPLVLCCSIRALRQWLLSGLLLWLHSHACALVLSDFERQYIQTLGPVTFCVDPDWKPFEIIDDRGQHVGIAADLLALVAQRTGVPMRLLRTPDWPASIEASKSGRCKLLSFLNQTPERDKWLIFTAPLLTDENILITREEHPLIVDLASLSGKTIALPIGTAMEERVRRDFPNLKIILTQNETQALSMVSQRSVDMTIRSLIVAAYTIKHEGWFNLKIAGKIPGYGNLLRIGVRSDDTRLRDILSKGVSSITLAERNQITDRHIAINVVTPINRVWLQTAALVLLLVLLSGWAWIRRLRRLNLVLKTSSQTDELTGLLNRTNLQTVFKGLAEQSDRSKKPLSVILLDIDFFKKVNDELGHLMGDKVLKEVAVILRQESRASDIVCRWGGEEFLVICPETSPQQAALLAERILQTVRVSAFSSQRKQTISAGISTLTGAESADELFQRADDALYQSKINGRDQVTVLCKS